MRADHARQRGDVVWHPEFGCGLFYDGRDLGIVRMANIREEMMRGV